MLRLCAKIMDGRMLYCLVARDAPSRLARAMEELNGPLSVCVIHERRRIDRRRAKRRQVADGASAADRRTIRGFDGRRVAERRAPVVDVDPLRHPHAPHGDAASVRYVERVDPGERHVADTELARLVLRFQGGERSAIEDIYRLVFPELYAYFHVVLGAHAEAEDATQQVMLSALGALPGFQLRRGTPVRAWLFSLARHDAFKHVKRRRRYLLEEPEALVRRRELMGTAADASLGQWVNDPELMALIERLPRNQQQVLVLRYMLGMRTSEIAIVLDKTSQAVRHLESRALRFLKRRLAAAGRGPARVAHPAPAYP